MNGRGKQLFVVAINDQSNIITGIDLNFSVSIVDNFEVDS